MTDPDFYWLVGLLEGEGSFMKGPPSNVNSPVVSAVSTDEDVIARIGRLWRVKYHAASPARSMKHGWKVAYRVALRGSKAVAFMRRIQMHMSLRRQAQIAAALNSYDPDLRLRHCGKLTPEQVNTIRAWTGKLKDMGARFGVSYATVSRIRSGRQWSRLPRLHNGSA